MVSIQDYIEFSGIAHLNLEYLSNALPQKSIIRYYKMIEYEEDK